MIDFALLCRYGDCDLIRSITPLEISPKRLNVLAAEVESQGTVQPRSRNIAAFDAVSGFLALVTPMPPRSINNRIASPKCHGLPPCLSS